MIPLGVLASPRIITPSGVTLTYRGSSAWSGSARTFNIGDPAPGREVIVVMSTAEHYYNGGYITNPGTIGGVPALYDCGYGNDKGSIVVVRASVPNGTTAEVIMPDSYGISYMVWTTDKPVVLLDTVNAAQTGASVSASLGTAPGGFAIVYGLNAGSSAFASPLTYRGASYWGRGADAPTSGGPATFTVADSTDTRALFSSFGPRGLEIVDSFDRPNSTTGLGRADSGHVWTVSPGTVTGITNGTAQRISGLTAAWTDFGQTMMHVSANFVATGAWWPNLKACMNADGSGGFTVQKDAGNYIKIGYGSAFYYSDGDKIGLRVFKANATQISVSLLINDVVKITSPPGFFAVPAASQTFAGFALGNTGDARIDNFRVEAS